MCISAAIIAASTVLAAGVGAYSSIQSANANARAAKYESAVRTKQLRERRSIERLAALEAENERSSEFSRLRSAAFAAIGASGLGENISFFQGTDPEQKRAFLRDVRNIRLGFEQSRSTIADEIQVSAFGVRMAKANAGIAKIGAIADFARTAMSAASFYSSVATPAAAGAGR